MFLTEEAFLGFVAVAIRFFPTILVLFYYIENMLHRKKKLIEIGLIVVFGPLLRWLCSVRLLSLRLLSRNETTDVSDMEKFVSAAKMIDGIVLTSVEIIWLLYLIAIEVLSFPPS